MSSESGSSIRRAVPKAGQLLNAILAALFITSSLAILLAHENGLVRDAVCTSLKACTSSPNANFWNKLIYDIGMAALLSLMFYLLLVKLPETLKRRRIRRGLERHYRSFKLGCLAVILSVVDKSYNSETLEKLLEKSAFRVDFKRDAGANMNRWHLFLNNITENEVQEIQTLLHLLREEIFYVLNNIEIDRDDIFEFLKDLGRQIYWLKDSTPDYDGIGRLSGFLWSTLSGWDLVTGYNKPDIVEAMIAEI